MNKMNKKGFTLIEMLVVIAIIAVLVSIIIPVVGGSTTKAQAATNAANLRSLQAEYTINQLTKGDDASYTSDAKFYPFTADQFTGKGLENSDFNVEQTTPTANSDGLLEYQGLTATEWADLAS